MLRDRYTCRICGTRHRARELDVDHIIEIARGGAALEYSNLQTVCRVCHGKKTRAFLSQSRSARGSDGTSVDSPGDSDRSSSGIENGSPLPVL
ncbi:MAG: HNH endonuclease [Thermoplasmata archaeon]|nr:HNH endonuclease [Thermoplasmata archaeon]